MKTGRKGISAVVPAPLNIQTHRKIVGSRSKGNSRGHRRLGKDGDTFRTVPAHCVIQKHSSACSWQKSVWSLRLPFPHQTQEIKTYLRPRPRKSPRAPAFSSQPEEPLAPGAISRGLLNRGMIKSNDY